MLKRLAIAYPSGNVTAIIFDRLQNYDRKILNNSIMSAWKKKFPNKQEIEQCCFVRPAINKRAIARIEMLGGEFCGNATRSVVHLLTKGEDSEGYIESSGVSHMLSYRVKNKEIILEMPLPISESISNKVEEGVLIHLDGITHLIVDDLRDSPEEILKNLLKVNKYKIKSLPAFGLTFFDKDKLEAQFCVKVNAIDTIFNETACGSGTCAIGIALALKNKSSIDQTIIQPSGGKIRTLVNYDTEQNKIISSYIIGNVEIMYDGEFFL